MLMGTLHGSAIVEAAQPQARLAPLAEVTAFDLIIAMNTLRVSYGLPALVEDPIINIVAQSTAETMAADQMSWHIGDISGRLAAAGYGGGSTVWATENFAVGNLSIDEIMVIWSDDSHMIPAVNPAYCNIGAGIAKASNGRNYYILQAAYTSAKSCGEYRSPGGRTTNGGTSQLIIPVQIATPDAEGNVYHVVEAGQSFWAIAIAYKITIQDLETWNNLSRESNLKIGQRLFIPGPDTEGYHTPTPVGMIQISTPDSKGRLVHTVQEYQTLTTIAQAYGTTINTILTLNNIQAEWPLQIGQELVIDMGNVTPSSTPRPLTPIEKLTPASDGRYYHTVQTGENLTWIADLYDVNLVDLMTWNGLSESSILYPEQQLLLQVTPPATDTQIPSPTTTTQIPSPTTTKQTATALPSSPTPSQFPTEIGIAETGDASSIPTDGNSTYLWVIPLALLGGGSLLVVFLSRKKAEKDSS